MKRITVITGHYGSGKTNVSVNLAVDLAESGKKVTVIDLDIVNPYFRTADFAEFFKERGIELITPMYANTNLDIPAINFDLERIVSDDGYVIIDVGGDDAGAIALGRYAEALEAYTDDVDMMYVINCYRYLTRTPEEALKLFYEIETAARMKHTAIINNSNLGPETNEETIKNSLSYANSLSEKTNLPIAFTSVTNGLSLKGDGFKTVDVYVKPLWEED